MRRFSFRSVFYVMLIAQLFYWAIVKQVSFPLLISQNYKTISFLELYSLVEQTLIPFWVSFKIFISVIAVNLVFSLCLAHLIVKKRFLKKINFLFYIPILAPIVMPAFGFYDFLIDYDLLGTTFSVVLVQSSFMFPFMLRPIENALEENRFYYEKIAYNLGESKLRTFFNITLPLLKKPIGVGCFLTLIASFNDYIITFLIGDTQVKSLPLTLLPLMQSDNRASSSLSVLLYLVPIVLLIFLFKEDKGESHA